MKSLTALLITIGMAATIWALPQTFDVYTTKLVRGQITADLGAVSGSECATSTFSVSGIKAGAPVDIGPDEAFFTGAHITMTGRCTADGVLTIQRCNSALVASPNPASANIEVAYTIFQ